MTFYLNSENFFKLFKKKRFWGGKALGLSWVFLIIFQS